jgi:hypothetical protein
VPSTYLGASVRRWGDDRSDLRRVQGRQYLRYLQRGLRAWRRRQRTSVQLMTPLAPPKELTADDLNENRRRLLDG